MSDIRTMYFPARRSLRERKMVTNSITGEATGTRWETVGYETGRVEITVDFAMLSRLLGEKAMKSKKGKSKMGHGAITVSVVRGSREQVRT